MAIQGCKYTGCCYSKYCTDPLHTKSSEPLEFNIASRQVNITANRSTGKVKLVLPGDQVNRYTVRTIDQTNLTRLIHRLIKARDYLAKGEELPF